MRRGRKNNNKVHNKLEDNKCYGENMQESKEDTKSWGEVGSWKLFKILKQSSLVLLLLISKHIWFSISRPMLGLYFPTILKLGMAV